MQTILWLDDIRNPLDFIKKTQWILTQFPRFNPNIHKIVWVKSYEEFIEYISKNPLPIHISFDHDLGSIDVDGIEYILKSGYDCCKWLVDYCLDNDISIKEVGFTFWKHLSKDGHTFVRGLMPRLNEPFLHIFLENCIDKIDCLEITQEDIDNMD